MSKEQAIRFLVASEVERGLELTTSSGRRLHESEKSLIRLLVVLGYLIVSAHATLVAAQMLDPVETELRALSQIANSYPPRVETAQDRERAEALWRSLEARLLERLKASPGNFALEMKLGECYRMGHNLDIDGAWEKAVVHFKEAARIEPTSPLPPTLLGQHYSGSGRTDEAEAELLRALALSGEKPAPQIHFNLAFTYYQRQQFEKAALHSGEYLKFDPSSQMMKLIKDRSEAALRGESEPKTIIMEVEPGKPPTSLIP